MLKAFQNTWTKACQSGGTVLIVDGTYLVDTIQFEGPCKGQVSFMVNAVVQAPPGKSNSDYWISFKDITGLIIQGNGTFDGQGSSAWSFDACQHAAFCTPLSPVSSVKCHSSIVSSAKYHYFPFDFIYFYRYPVDLNNKF